MLAVYHDAGSGNNWDQFNKYDGQGRLILSPQPSAVNGYNDSYSDLLHYVSGSGYQYLNNNSGLISVIDYGSSTTATASTAGDVTGYQKDDKIEQGQNGTAIKLDSQQYFLQSAGSTTIYPLANSTQYRNTDGTGAETTSYSYTFFAGTVQVQSLAVSLPVISSAQNGPGTAEVSTTFNDNYGRPIWTKDADGFLTYTAYDQATGSVIKTISDVNTTDTGDFSNLPTGWTTPVGGGLELITQDQVDPLGRTVKETDPDGNVTYTACIDANYEERVYAGWNSSTSTPTGPTQDSRYDRAGSYMESLSMSATPHVSLSPPAAVLALVQGGSLPATTYYVKISYLVNGVETAASAESNLMVAANALLKVTSPSSIPGATGYNVYVATASGQEVLQNGSTPIGIGTAWTEPASGLVTGTAAPPTSGGPDGTEAVSSLQTLARDYTNSAGQATASDSYFNLSGVTYSTAAHIGTLNTNYYETTDDYDARGRPTRSVSATGTITRTVYDGLDRVVSTWVGHQRHARQRPVVADQ
jgi:YD repeat-containing protein